MHFGLLPTDVSLPTRERWLVGICISLAHLLVLTWALQFASHRVAGAGDGQTADGSPLSVTFVSLSHPVKSATADPMLPLPLAPDPENGTAIQTTHTDQGAEMLQVFAETGQRISPIPLPREQVSTINQVAAVSTSPVAKAGGFGDDRLAVYHAALRAAIRRKWQTLTERPFPSGCRLRMRLAMGGGLNATSANGCALSSEDRLQVEAAALMAQPLPYAGFESEFTEQLSLAL